MSFLNKIPEDTNPYDYYIRITHDELFGKADDGYKVRMFVLLGLLTYMTLAALAIAVMTIETSCKRNGGVGVWLWRRIYLQNRGGSSSTRSQDYLIVTNSKLALGVFLSLGGLYFILFVINGIYVYAYHMTPRFQYPFQAFLPFLICIAGWMVTFGNTQIALLMHPDKILQLKYARWLNAVYVWGGATGLAYLFMSAGISSAVGYLFWNEAKGFTAWLLEHRTLYHGSPLDAADLAALKIRVLHYIQVRHRYSFYTAIEFAALPAFAIIVCVVNISTVFIARFLKTQINTRVDHLNLFRGHTSVSGVLGNRGAAQLSGINSPTHCSDNDSPTERPEPARLRISLPTQECKDLEMGIFKNLAQTDADDTEVVATKNPSPLPPTSLGKDGLRRIGLRELRHTQSATMEPGGEPPQHHFIYDELDRVNVLQILELDSTREYIMGTGLLVFLATTFSFAVAIFATTTLRSDYFFDSFARFEITVYTFPWACALSMGPMMTLMIHIQLGQRRMWKAKRTARIEVNVTHEVDVQFA